MRRLAIVVLLGGCGFHGKGADPTETPPGDDDQPTVDAATPDPDVDAAPVTTPKTMFAAAGTQLYAVDMTAKTATSIGTIGTTRLDGLAFDGTSILGLDEGGTTLLVIDPADAHIVATKTLDATGVFGLTVIPAGELDNNPAPIVLAADEDSLYRITSGGHVELVGAWSEGYTFASDLAWVHGRGLFVTLHADGGTTDAVRVDAKTGKTMSVLGTGFEAIYGLSGFNGSLFGVSKGGYVYAFDAAGQSSVVMMGGPSFTEAAQ